MRSVINESQVYPKGRYAWTDRTGITQPDFTGTGASAHAVITASVTGLTLTSGGSGYTFAPIVSAVGTGGQGFGAVATVSGGQVTGLTLVYGGSLFTGTPTITFTGGGGSGAAATANMSPYYVTSVVPTSVGNDYYAVPQVTLVGGGGTGSAWHAVLDPLSHTVFDYVQVSRGTTYTSPPAVVIQNIPMVLTGIIPISTADAGNLLVTVDSTVARTTVIVAVVFWDERNQPISIVFETLTTSAWATNSHGNYIVESLFSTGPAYLSFNVGNASGYKIFVMDISSGSVNLHSKLV